jgi:hypothetical protein
VIGNHITDIIVGHLLALAGADSAGFDAIGQELQCADTVVAEDGPHAVRIGPTCADTLGNTSAEWDRWGRGLHSESV